jgi:hypothetical protein
MATAGEHKLKALHNEQFLDLHNLGDGLFVDWAVTVLFYCALHWMRALAAQEGHQIKGYKDEEGVFIGTGVFTAEAYDFYRQLKDDSRDARYEMKPFSESDFEDLQVNFFQPFKAFIMRGLRA